MSLYWRTSIQGVSAVVFICTLGCKSTPKNYSAHLRATIKQQPEEDCFANVFDFREACCHADDNFFHLRLELGYSWQTCCAHLYSQEECTVDGKDLTQLTSVSREGLADEASCWTSEWLIGNSLARPFPREMCCDKSKSSSGLKECWVESEFTFSRCCGPAWLARQREGCSVEIMRDIEGYIPIPEGKSYAELFTSEHFAALWRIVRQALHGRIGSRPHETDVPCIVAFIVTRIMVFTKLDWISQFSILVRGRPPDDHDFSLDDFQQIQIAWRLLYMMPLTELTTISELSIPLLERLLSHSRKFRNFLTSDALPYPDSAFFPLMDSAMTPGVQNFFSLLQVHLNRGSVPTLEQINTFITVTEFSRSKYREMFLPPSEAFSDAFGLTMAYLALAYAHLQSTPPALRAALTALQNANKYFQRFRLYQLDQEQIPPEVELSHGIHAVHIMFTAWPFWKLLLALARLLATPAKREYSGLIPAADLASKTPGILLVYCGDLVPSRVPDGQGIGLRRLKGPDCRSEILDLLQSSLHDTIWIILISPFLMRWDLAEHLFAFRSAVHFLEAHKLSVAGFPVIDKQDRWRWPVHRIRHAHWHLRYEPYPTGHAMALGHCVGGDVTSSTRIYRADVLKQLVKDVKPDASDLTGALLLVELDLQAKYRKIPAYTCLYAPLREEATYLERAVLSHVFCTRYRIDLAEFGLHDDGTAMVPGSSIGFRQSDLCSVVGSSASDASESYSLVHQGMASKYCFRQRVQHIAVKLMAWWIGLDPMHNAVFPIQGTLLTTLVRGGAFGMMPWDLDLEFAFVSSGPNPIIAGCQSHTTDWESLVACTKTAIIDGVPEVTSVTLPSQTSFIPRFLWKQHRMATKIKLHVEGSVEINLISFVDIMSASRATFLGLEVRFTQQQWEYQFFEIYGGDLRKKVGTSGTVNMSAVCTPDSPISASACLVSDCKSDATLHHREHIDRAGEWASTDSCTLELSDWFAHVWPS